jgi:hypothetical protein
VSDRDRLADWLLSTEGRVARIVVGTAVILLGLGLIGGFLGVLLLLIGAVPIASAAYGALLVGPLLGRDIRGRRPEDQPAEEKDSGDSEDSADDDEPRDEEPSDEDEDRSESDDGSRTEPDEEWSAPPPARAERPPGQGPRTKDLRADEPDDSQR